MLIFGACGAVSIAIVSAVLLLLYPQRLRGDVPVARVNVEAVTARELERHILSKRGEVIAYFRERHGAEFGRGFWTRSYNGEVPGDVVKSRALDELVRIKIQFLLARREGFIQEIDDASIRRSMKEENERRKNAVARGQVVFGQIEYDEQTYESYLLSVVAAELKSELSESWRVSEDDIRGYYEQVKDRYYLQGAPSTYIPFDRVKDSLLLRYIDEKYGRYIDELARQATVNIEREQYDRVNVE